MLEGPFTTPRNETHIVVTEFGAVDLQGKLLHQRAEALVSIARPGFRGRLLKDA